jgi:hypothetical protein
MTNLLLSFFVTFGLTLSGSSSARTATPADRETVLQACAAVFGPPIDSQRGLFEVNRFYLLEVKFDERGRVLQLGVLPKHWFADDHPQWDETDDVGELTEGEYQSLLGRLEGIRSKGPLVKRAKMAVVTNLTARRRDRYKHAVLETGELVDAKRSDDAPRAIKYFIVYFTAARQAK